MGLFFPPSRKRKHLSRNTTRKSVHTPYLWSKYDRKREAIEPIDPLRVLTAPLVHLTSLTAPLDHLKIIQRVKVTTYPHTDDYVLQPHLRHVGYEVIPGTTDRRWITTWLYLNPITLKSFQSYMATGLVLDIWGPLDAEAYSLEFSRMDAMDVRIYIDDSLIWELPDVAPRPPKRPILEQVGHRWMFPGYMYIPVGPEKIVPGPEKIVNERIKKFYEELFQWALALKR